MGTISKVKLPNGTQHDIIDEKVAQNAAPASGTFDLLLAKTASSHTAETNTTYKSGSNLNFNAATGQLNISGGVALTSNDIVICTESEYESMQSRSGLFYLIKEGAPSP